MTRSSALPPGAWVVRVDMSRQPWVADVLSASTATDHVTTSARATTVLLGGLLHNRAELRQGLGEDRELEHNDASLVLRGYEKWDESTIERILGTCATVICDGERRTIVAARDRLGTYPLFFAEAGTLLLVSNSIEALLAQDGVPTTLNLPAVVDHMRHVWPFPDETYFGGIRRVPPGNVLRRDGGGTRLRRYWDATPEGSIDWIQPDEVDEFDTLFEQAILRCEAPGPTGIFLSGGLDSVSVAAVAATSARAAGEPDPVALSLVFPDPDANEEPLQRAVAASLGLRHVVLDWDTAVGPRGLVSEALDLSASSPAPLLNLWMPAYDRLAAAGRELGCVTILTGGGGDEWLLVSPYYAADLIRTLDLAGLLRLYNENRRSHRVSTMRLLRNMVWRFGLRPLAVDRTRALLLRRAPSTLYKLALRRLERKTPAWLATDPILREAMVEREVRHRDEQWSVLHSPNGRRDRRYPRFYFQEVRLSFEHPLVSMELEELYSRGRRLDMHVLQPFWDAQLVEFLCRTPPKLLNRAGHSKALVRQAVARRFPGLGFESQRKVTATGTLHSLVENECTRAWSELDGVGALATAGLVDSRALRGWVEDVLERRQTRHYFAVWDLLALERFVRVRRSK